MCVQFLNLLALPTIPFSRRSSKNRRKSERKKHSLREGSAFEDVALLDSIREIVGTVDKLQGELSMEAPQSSLV